MGKNANNCLNESLMIRKLYQKMKEGSNGNIGKVEQKIQWTLLKIVQITKSIYLPDSSLSLWLMKASSSLLRWKSCAYSASVKIFQWSCDDVILKYRVRSKIGNNRTNLHFTNITQVSYWSWGHEPAKSGKQGSININQIKNQKPVKRIQFPISWERNKT